MLERNQMMEVCNFLSKMCSISETQNFIKEKFKKDVEAEWIRKTFFRKNSRWKKAVLNFRAKYLADIDSVPGAHKKVRLERYDTLFEEALKQKKVAAAKAILDSMREEIEGKGKEVHIGEAIIAQINKMPDDELIRQKDRLLEKLEKLKRIGGQDA